MSLPKPDPKQSNLHPSMHTRTLRGITFRVAAAVPALLLGHLALCQAPSVTEALPQIQFEQWKQVPFDESTNEFDLSFPSAIQTPFPADNVVPLRVFIPADAKGPVPVVVMLHYWGATDLSEETELARELSRQSIASIAMVLPYHISRTPPGYRSGQLAVSPDPKALVDVMTQSTLDVRRTIDFIDSKPEFDHSRIGISGTSLGSLVSILAYSVDSRISTGAFMLGGIHLAHIIWRSSLIPGVREALRHEGYSEAALTSALTPVEPAKYLPNRSPGQTLVVGARFDTVIPPADTHALIDALPGCKVMWLDTGHYGGVFVEKRVLRTAANFFQHAFAGLPYTPPTRIYAPTLRLGAILDTTGFQLGAGVDLFKTGPQNDIFSTILVTPKGLNLFGGVSLGQGIAVGAFATPRRVSVGVWWSTVL